MTLVWRCEGEGIKKKSNNEQECIFITTKSCSSNKIFHDIGVPPAQIVVPGTTTTALLQQLLPNTDYNVGVVALYSDGEGPALSDAGKTCKIPVSCIPKPSPLELIGHRIDSVLVGKEATATVFLSQCPAVAQGTSVCTTPRPAP